MIRKIWKKVPYRFRSLMHHSIHILNNSKFLLFCVGPVRQFIGARVVSNLSDDFQLLVVGESHQISGAYTTNYQVFTKRFLDATKLKQVKRKFHFLYSDNVVEHLPLQLAREMFLSSFEILEHGGTMRLCTPDAGALVELYKNAEPEIMDMIRKDLAPHSILIEYPVDILRQGFSKFGHHKGFLFDRCSIQMELENAGFTNISFFPVSKSNFEKLSNLESRVGGSHEFTQMCVEATKPHKVQ